MHIATGAAVACNKTVSTVVPPSSTNDEDAYVGASVGFALCGTTGSSHPIGEEQIPQHQQHKQLPQLQPSLGGQQSFLVLAIVDEARYNEALLEPRDPKEVVDECTLIAGGGVCVGGRLPVPASSVPSVLLSLLSPPPPPPLPTPLSSSPCRMPPCPPPYILPARRRWRRRSRNTQRAYARPSNHRRCERAEGRGRGGRP